MPPNPVSLMAVLGLALSGPLASQAPPRRPITLEDLNRLREVSDPEISPDGRWVAYVVSAADREGDRRVGDLWLASWDGLTAIRLTKTPQESEHTPRWSPDGRQIAFLSSRGGDRTNEADQLWLLDLAGGEAERLTQFRTGIQDFAWSPDGRRVVLVMTDGDSVEDGAADSTWRTTRPPIVIDRFAFKDDTRGYLTHKRQHLYLFDLERHTLDPLTPGPFDEMLPAWSPDGRYLAFVSKRAGPDPDRHDNYDLWVMQAVRDAVPFRVTSFEGPDSHPDWEAPPAWSPDGRRLAYLQGGPDRLIYYATHRLAVIPWGGGSTRLLSEALDRNVELPRWAPDGRSLYGIVEDDRTRRLVRFPLDGSRPETIVGGRRVVSAYSVARDGRLAVLLSSPDQPGEVYAVAGEHLRNLSRQNDSLLGELALAPVEEITVKSRDGTPIYGFLVRPLGALPGRRYPTVLRIHGGPVAQLENSFNFFWQLLAAQGYAVVAMNPRGSSGRGEPFARAIWADWGHKDAEDVLAGVDYAVSLGVADPDRLGVGGWSYGGMLTNYVIAQDPRFKAAVSGAAISNILAGYGTDMYVREYEAELGTPWTNLQGWLKLSAPFLHADRIRTPTLFLCGEKDFNVPLLNSEQMYQALRSLEVPTQLVIYPGERHMLSKLSYQADHFRRSLEWYREHLRP